MTGEGLVSRNDTLGTYQSSRCMSRSCTGFGVGTFSLHALYQARHE